VPVKTESQRANVKVVLYEILGGTQKMEPWLLLWKSMMDKSASVFFFAARFSAVLLQKDGWGPGLFGEVLSIRSGTPVVPFHDPLGFFRVVLIN
jgi:hypothetical protein